MPFRSTAMALLICTTTTLAANSRPTPAPPPEINLRHSVTVEVVRKTKDAVVNISAIKTVARRVSPFGGADPFWQQFDTGQVIRVPASSLGSGFIIHPDGYVVTNHHVIDRARKIQVELADGRKLDADLISSDADSDLAILKILPPSKSTARNQQPFPSIELGDSSDLMIGEPVIAVGNPLGYSHSVSTGIVSAIHRDIKDRQDQVIMADLVQTDAAINPGNSGGPLLNAYGQVIGINTAIRGDAQNIGFAIQVNRLRDLIPELMSPLHVTKMDLPLKLVERRKVTPPAHIDCSVSIVGQNARIVRSIDGRKISDIVDAYAALLRVRPDQNSITLLLDDGARQTIPLRPAPQPGSVIAARNRLGVTLEQVTPMLAEKNRLETEDGLYVTEVLNNSAAARAGLKPGDIIIQLGRYRVSSLDDLNSLLQHLRDGDRVRIGIIRGDRVGYTTLQL